jgi:hypothetical protein
MTIQGRARGHGLGVATRVGAVVALALAGGGCHDGSFGGIHGCSSVQGSCKLGAVDCTDYGGYDTTSLQALQSGCFTAGGTWAMMACDTEGVIGGCETALEDVCIVVWEYPPKLVSTEQHACESGADGNVWVTP